MFNNIQQDFFNKYQSTNQLQIIYILEPLTLKYKKKFFEKSL